MKTTYDIVQNAFRVINDFKRSRTLEEVAKENGDTAKVLFHQLNQAKAFDKIELSMRAINSNERGRHCNEWQEGEEESSTACNRIRAVN